VKVVPQELINQHLPEDKNSKKMSAAPPINPNYGQVFTKGVKYLKINKIDKDGEVYGPQLTSADNININYPDIGSVQYDILTTQDQGTYYLMGVVPSVNTSSLNNVKDLDLTVARGMLSVSLDQLDVAVWNNDNDLGLYVVGGNGGNYYNDSTDIWSLNTANTPTSVTSSISVDTVVGTPIYFSVIIPSSSVAAWVEGIPVNLWGAYDIQLLNVITITGGSGVYTAASTLNNTFGGDYYFGGVNVSLFGGSFSINQITEEINQSTIQPPQVSNSLLLNINPDQINFEWSDYNAIFGNATDPQFSNIYQDVDYGEGPIPINFNLIISGSAVKAPIQDSNYSQRGWSNGRYDGSRNSSTDFNQ
jgi:hypothetical protein